MSDLLLTDLAKACRASGLPVVEVPGWKTRNRPARPFAPRGQVVHHTGAHGTRNRAEELAYVKRVLVGGYPPELPGPLCQLALGRQTVDGPPVIYVVAAGRANHAGPSRDAGFIRAGDGNTQSIGWEAINSGDEGWSREQLDAYHRGVAAVADHYGWSRGAVVAHAESSTAGKWDPGVGGRVIDMSAFRAGVKNVNLTTPLENGFLMALSDKQQKKLVADVEALVDITKDLAVGREGVRRDGPGGAMLREIRNGVRALLKQAPQVDVEVDAKAIAREILDQLPNDLAGQVVTELGAALSERGGK